MVIHQACMKSWCFKDQEIYSKKLPNSADKNLEVITESLPVIHQMISDFKVLNNVSVSFKQGTRKQQDTYLDKIKGMVFGDSEQSGVRRGSKFYHGLLNLYLCTRLLGDHKYSKYSYFTSSYGEASR